MTDTPDPDDIDPAVTAASGDGGDGDDGGDAAEDVGSEHAADPGEFVGPNLFADNRRRRIPGILYCIIGGATGIGWIIRAGNDPVLINAGMGVAALLLIVFGAYSIITGWSLDVDDEAALEIAAVATQRPMGHAAAQIGWRGWLSRPTWRILWYSAEDPPRQRGLVLIDAHDGQVLDSMIEDNPEDWTAMGGSLDHVADDTIDGGAEPEG